MDIMSVESWIAITTGELALLGAAAAGVKYLVKKYLSELRPNGGSSIHDKINKEILPLLKDAQEERRQMRKELRETREDVAELRGRFTQHVDENAE